MIIVRVMVLMKQTVTTHMFARSKTGGEKKKERKINNGNHTNVIMVCSITQLCFTFGRISSPLPILFIDSTHRAVPISFFNLNLKIFAPGLPQSIGSISNRFHTAWQTMPGATSADKTIITGC